MSPTSPHTDSSHAGRDPTRLTAITLAFALSTSGLWLTGWLAGVWGLRFSGFMMAASTFLPFPADAYILAQSINHDPITIGVLGGALNAASVVVFERPWILELTNHPRFSLFRLFVGQHRWVAKTEKLLFLGLLIGGFSFLPFEPFRLVAVLRRYNPMRYALATFLGRGFRYYLLAELGTVFDDFGLITYVIWASLALFAFGVMRSYRRFQVAQ